MALTNVHSYSNPEVIRVTDIHLILFVDFNRNILDGEAILRLRKQPGHMDANELILDNYGLTICTVKNFDTFGRTDLEYNIGKHCNIFGSKFIIKILSRNEICAIRIKYKTSPNSPALYWLKPEHTSDGIHPLLISNNKLTYARAVFPCQDTPSVKFDFSAVIFVPKDFRVIMSGLDITNIQSCDLNHDKYKFLQTRLISSYEVVIMVGKLEKEVIHTNIQTKSEEICITYCIWTEQKYIQKSKIMLYYITRMLDKLQTNFIEKWRTCHGFNVCVLPPNVPEFDIQCPYVTFISSTLLKYRYEINIFVVKNIIESWTASLIWICNFEDLWLIKSFSKFIWRKLLHHTLGDEIKKLLDVKSIIDLKKLHDDHSFEKRVPLIPFNMMKHSEESLYYHQGYYSPKDIIKYVPYEKGNLLLNYLESRLGTDFNDWLDYFFKHVNGIMLTTEEFKQNLFNFFNLTEIKSILHSINWNMWFYDRHLNSFFHYFPQSCSTMMDGHLIAKQYIMNEIRNESFAIITKICNSSYFDKIEFLTYLYTSPTELSRDKFNLLRYVYLTDKSIEIKFLWLRLCIKNKWLTITEPALEFACKYCTPKYACPIFRDLYEWPVTRYLALSWFQSREKRLKMLPEVIKELKSILQVELDDE